MKKSFSRSVMLDSLWPQVAHQAPLSMELSRQGYWSGLPFLFQGIFPTQGSNPGLLHCGRFFIFWAIAQTLMDNIFSKKKYKYKNFSRWRIVNNSCIVFIKVFKFLLSIIHCNEIWIPASFGSDCNDYLITVRSQWVVLGRIQAHECKEAISHTGLC